MNDGMQEPEWMMVVSCDACAAQGARSCDCDLWAYHDGLNPRSFFDSVPPNPRYRCMYCGRFMSERGGALLTPD